LAVKAERAPPLPSAIVVQCMTCRHRAELDGRAMARFGVKADAPIAAFVKRLRCSHCGSGNVRARRPFKAAS
jgi:hypothetical protein